MNMNSKFDKNEFIKDGIYLLYGKKERKFVARFKHGGPFTMAKFKKELINSHSPESYFQELARGKAPLTILKDKNPSWYKGILDNFMLGH